jgi:serine/threonine-protein kinase
MQPETATGALSEHTLLNGRYDVVGVLGRGAMGAVYNAHDLQQDEPVAIKEMSDEALGAGQREQAIDQFRREALLLQALNHPNLVRVRDVFTAGRRHYLVMDYVEGQPLSELAPVGGQTSEVEVRAWALQLCDVLAYLHSRQPPVIFRDLKPENVMLATDAASGEDRITLVDFGIARFFDPQKDQDTMAIGTRGYMAPEAFYGQTDARSDLYSLGVLIHRLLTGFDPAESPWDLPDARELAPDVSEAPSSGSTAVRHGSARHPR